MHLSPLHILIDNPSNGAKWGGYVASGIVTLIGVAFGFYISRWSRWWGKIKPGDIEFRFDPLRKSSIGTPESAPLESAEWEDYRGSIHLFNERDIPVGLYRFRVQFLKGHHLVYEEEPKNSATTQSDGLMHFSSDSLKAVTLEPHNWAEIKFHGTIRRDTLTILRSITSAQLVAKDTFGHESKWQLHALDSP